MRVPIALPLLLASAAHATAGGVVKLDSPPKPDWQVIQADAGIMYAEGKFTTFEILPPGTPTIK